MCFFLKKKAFFFVILGALRGKNEFLTLQCPVHPPHEGVASKELRARGRLPPLVLKKLCYLLVF